jgi:hypothetical protein
MSNMGADRVVITIDKPSYADDEAAALLDRLGVGDRSEQKIDVLGYPQAVGLLRHLP